jgi:NAD(P)-dependent dehydrogenase (short-subunit alcohol dehydrogenase family)
MKLQGKTAIITGAAAGIGAASAELFASAGANVVAVDLEWSTLEQVAQRIAAAGGSCTPMRGDVSRRAEVQNVIAAAIEKFGRVDILFNNAGIVTPGKIEAISEDQWDCDMAVNVKSVYLFCHELIPHFRQRGGGVILNTASATALRAVADRASYTATKAAIVGLTKSMAVDCVGDNIRVNCLCPGTVDTPSLAQRLAAFPDPAAARKNFMARQPLGRFGKAEEVAYAALYLVSDEAAFVTGTAFAIDGGMSL